MKLSKLFDSAPNIEIDYLMEDSRSKMKNAMFFCVKGMIHDGHKYIDEAIANGAVCIVHSEDIEVYNENVTYIRVSNVLSAMNRVADLFNKKPSSKLKVFGVTGTNGKSTISQIIHSTLSHFTQCGYIGTISIEYGDIKEPPMLTTPDIIPLQHILKKMVDAKMKAVSLEVSSIGLEQCRVDSVDFDYAIYTNLTHDHLDYHGTMENYFEAKKKLFTSLSEDKTAIINVDDEYAQRIMEGCVAHCVTYGILNRASYQAKDIQLFADKTTFTLACYNEEYQVETNLVALFNVYNLLAVIASLHQYGLKIEEILQYVSCIKQIEGRMERIEEGQPFHILVDFAHTPDGLEKIFTYAANITPKEKRIIAVFGSAGKRDRKKRPVFGELADKYCDMIILTEDDPRDENIYEICEEISSGIKNTNCIIIEDRYDAIRQAIEMANVSDTILILGKGDEIFLYREFGREPYIGDHIAVKEILHKYYFGDYVAEEEHEFS